MTTRRSMLNAVSMRFSHVLIATFVVGAMLPFAWGQDPPQYDVLPLHKEKGRDIANWNDLNSVFMRDEMAAILAMLDNGQIDQARFDKFFNDIVFPIFTHEPNFKHDRVSVAKTRQRGFKEKFVGQARNQAAKDKLFDLTLKKMEQIATGNFHPWARINAAIMVAELNESEPNGPPLKKALPPLMKWASDPQLPDIVRIPAMRGLVHHASTPNALAAQDRPKLQAAMLVIAKQHTATPEQSLDGHEWIMRRSIDVLAALGDPGAKNAVIDELLKIVDDEAAPRSARAGAAKASAKILVKPPKDFDAEGYAKSLGKLAVAAYKAELADAASNRQPIAAARLKQQLAEIRTGLASENGKSTAAIFTTEVLKKFATDSIAQLDAMIKACDTPPDFEGQQKALSDPNSIPNVPYDLQQTIAKAISTAGGGLEAVLQAGPGGNAAPAVGPAEGPAGPLPATPVKPAPVVAPK